MSDKIAIKNLQFLAFCGTTDEERKTGCRLSADIELFFNLHNVAKYDDLSKTVDYSQVCKVVEDIAEKKFNLLESLAENVADGILKRFEIEKVIVRIRKIPPIKSIVDYVEVEIERERK